MKNVLGIDIGSVSVGLCEITPGKKIVDTGYEFHHGRITGTLAGMLEEIDLTRIGSIATSSSTPAVIKSSTTYDNQVAVIAAAKYLHDQARAVISVGGEKFSLIRFDDHAYDVYLGVDIGSTSTKAVLLDDEKTVLAGCYTWTAGRPVDALCALCEAIDDLVKRKDLPINIIGTGTTGSGRKLIGKLMNADSVVDEITAHARAACEP